MISLLSFSLWIISLSYGISRFNSSDYESIEHGVSSSQVDALQTIEDKE